MGKWNTNPIKYRNYTTMVAALFLAALTCLLHGSALRAWWRVDDPWILLYVLEHPDPLGFFTCPGEWRSLWTAFFTPWLALDFWADAKIFGLNPLGFYLHHLTVVWLAALLTFVLLGRTVGRVWGAVAAVLFLTGSAVTVVCQQVMSRHYASGLVFTILAISFWVRNREEPKRHLLVLAVVCYLAAMLNKEVFAPLPLVLLFLGSDRLGARLRDLAPFVVGFVLFGVWRAVMLGVIVGGYHGGLDAAGDVVRSLRTLAQVFFGVRWFAPAAGLLLVLAAVAVGRQSRQRCLAMIAAVASVILPLLALRVSPDVTHFRLAFVPWWACCVLVAVGGAAASRGWGAARSHRQRRVALPLWFVPIVVVAVLGGYSGRSASRRFADVAAAYDVQGRFLWATDERVAYVPSGAVASDLQYQYAMSGIKESVLGRRAPRAVPTVGSAAWLAGSVPVYQYDRVGRRMVRLEARAFPDTRDSGFRPALPLSLRLARSERGMEWSVKGPSGASCALVFLDLNAAFSIPCIGRIQFDPPPFARGDFRVFILTPEDEWNVSPVLAFPDRGETTEWHAMRGNRSPDSTVTR